MIHLQILSIGKIVLPLNVKKICNNSLSSIFEIATWLRNFSIINGVACDKIASKSKSSLGEFYDQELGETSEMNKFLKEYSKIIKITNSRYD